MKILSPQAPTFGHVAPLSPSAVETAFAELHELGLRIDRAAPSPHPPFLAEETAHLVAQVTEQLKVLDHQRRRLNELLAGIV